MQLADIAGRGDHRPQLDNVRGAAVCAGALGEGVADTAVLPAVEKLIPKDRVTYTPIPEHAKRYEELYSSISSC